MKIQRRKRSRTLFALLAATSVAFMGACSGGADDPLVMPDVVGLNLDVALSDLERVGYEEDPEILGGGTFGVVNESNWEVCEQLPAPGEEITTQPRLTVERDCGFGDDDESEEAITEEETESVPEPTEEETTEETVTNEPEEATEEEPTPTEDAAAPTGDSGDSGRRSGFNAAEVEQAYLDHLGPDRDFWDMCMDDETYTHWTCFYEGVENTSQYLQVNLDTYGTGTPTELQELAEMTGRHWFNFIGCDFPDLDTIVVSINGQHYNTYRSMYFDLCS